MKNRYREIFSQRLKDINKERRETASFLASEQISILSVGHRYVLSYASMRNEFSTLPINDMLAKEGRLLLPRIRGNDLHIFPVDDPSDLEETSWGLMQPVGKKEFDISLITFVLVPGIGFDRKRHRIGYGKGYYDRFLKKLNPNTITIGIGFKEQFLSDADFPSSEHDVQLTSLLIL